MNLTDIVSTTRDVTECCEDCIESATLHIEVLSKEQDCESVIYELDLWIVCDGIECDHSPYTLTFPCNEVSCQTVVVGSGFGCCPIEVTFGNSPECTCDPCVPVECEGCQRPLTLEICGFNFTPTLVALPPPDENIFCWGYEQVGVPECCTEPLVGCTGVLYWGVGLCCDFDAGDESETYTITVSIICLEDDIPQITASGSCSFNMDCLEFGCHSCQITVRDFALPTPNVVCDLLATVCKT
jgi:hypothetical protein